jgi:hypothetical protein
MAQKLTLPGPSTKGGWSISVSAIREAIDFLELTAPVEVKLAAGLRRHGAHRFRDGVHVITLSTYLNVEQASFTLWHELTHAAQTDYLGRQEFVAAYNNESRMHGYSGNAFEVEANQMAADMVDTPLTRRA